MRRFILITLIIFVCCLVAITFLSNATKRKKMSDPIPENVITTKEQYLYSPSGEYILSLELYDDSGVSSYKIKVESDKISILSDECIRQRDTVYALWDDTLDRVWVYSGDVGTYFWDITEGKLVRNSLSERKDVKIPENLKLLRPQYVQ